MTVSKVVIKNGRAVGIQAIEDGVARTYSARREVIDRQRRFWIAEVAAAFRHWRPGRPCRRRHRRDPRAARASGRTCRTTWTWTSSTNSPTTTAWTGSIACARRPSWPASSTWPSARDRSRPTCRGRRLQLRQQGREDPGPAVPLPARRAVGAGHSVAAARIRHDAELLLPAPPQPGDSPCCVLRSHT